MRLGFGLIELLISITVSLIIISGSIFSLANSKALLKYKLSLESDKIIKFLNTIRFYAVRNNQNLSVTLFQNNLVTDGFKLKLLSNYQYKFNSRNKNLVFYSSNTASPKTILVKSKELVCKIIVSLRARIRKKC